MSKDRKAILYKKSKNGRKAIYIDENNAKTILIFLKKERASINKFIMVAELLLEHTHVPRDLYGKENFEKGCENVYAIKLFRGKKNPRIYCQQYSHKEKEIFVIIVSELLEKKKSKSITNKEKSIIRRVASYQYKFKDDE